MGICAVHYGYLRCPLWVQRKIRFSAERGADLRGDIYRTLQIP